jgi:hypothetical protein
MGMPATMKGFFESTLRIMFPPMFGAFRFYLVI